MTLKTEQHTASETAVRTASERVAAARTAELEASARIREAIAAKDTLLASSGAGNAVTAKQMLDAERHARDAETQQQFAAASLRGAQEAYSKALADFRIHEQEFYKRCHRELMEQQARVACEADKLLAAARSKLVEYDDAKSAFDGLRAAADASLAAPLWPLATLNSPIDPLPRPVSYSGVELKITRVSGGFENQYGSLQHALGHGRPQVAA